MSDLFDRAAKFFQSLQADICRELATADGAKEFGGPLRPDGPALFEDSVGIGCYRIDLHPRVSGAGYLDLGCWPFQIPLGAMIPVRVENLLPGGKNLGVTHITNGAFRVHPVEWNVGEVAGLLAAFCLDRGLAPRAVRLLFATLPLPMSARDSFRTS